MRRRNDGAGSSPQGEFEDVCFHALGIIDQNREYLQMHLLASADLPTRQALSDIQIESARVSRTVHNAMLLYRLENGEPCELQPFDVSELLEKAERMAPDIEKSLEIQLDRAGGRRALRRHGRTRRGRAAAAPPHLQRPVRLRPGRKGLGEPEAEKDRCCAPGGG